MKDYTISDPITGDTETFATRAAAVKAAKRKDYTPVFVNIYDWDVSDTVDDIEVVNKGKKEI